MSRVFIGGSRKIARLNEQVRRRLDEIVARGLTVLVGDANGADKAVQAYLRDREYAAVTVFCTGGECRNNVGHWPVRVVTPPHRNRDFEYYTAKDAAMAHEADYGLMLWDGQSSGTVVNVARMVSAGKPVVIYLAPERRFVTSKSRRDLSEILQACGSEVQEKVSHYISEHAPEFAQAGLF